MAVHQFTVNKDVWDGLKPEDQQALTKWYYDAYADLLQALDAEDQRLVARDQKDPDIEVVNWAQEDRDAFRQIATGAWESTAERSPEARKALDAHYAFMKKIGLLK